MCEIAKTGLFLIYQNTTLLCELAKKDLFVREISCLFFQVNGDLEMLFFVKHVNIGIFVK